MTLDAARFALKRATSTSPKKPLLPINIKLIYFAITCLVIVRYRFNKVFVQKVMTHREYDDWNKLYRKGKV